jgi:hypothetical protein
MLRCAAVTVPALQISLESFDGLVHVDSLWQYYTTHRVDSM